MSTIKEIADSKVTITIAPKQGILQSLVKNLIFLSIIAFCVYLSQDSKWWTFVTGSIFLFTMSAKLLLWIKNSSTTFSSKEDAIKYLNKL